MKAVTGYSHTHRIVTEGQRLALIARDQGCSFPDCTAPPARTRAHHIHEHQHCGETSTRNTTLVCGHHHRELGRPGRQVTIHDGQPAWIPPPWIDPHQKPITR